MGRATAKEAGARKCILDITPCMAVICGMRDMPPDILRPLQQPPASYSTGLSVCSLRDGGGTHRGRLNERPTVAQQRFILCTLPTGIVRVNRTVPCTARTPCVISRLLPLTIRLPRIGVGSTQILRYCHHRSLSSARIERAFRG